MCKAADCAHISPIFHAETLAIHILITSNNFKKLGNVTIYTTAEPDAMSQSAIHWANVVHDVGIRKICFGASLKTIQQIWPFGINISAKEIIERSNPKLELIGPVNEIECNNLFRDAKLEQNKINKQHPAQGILSNDIKDFYQLTV